MWQKIELTADENTEMINGGVDSSEASKRLAELGGILKNLEITETEREKTTDKIVETIKAHKPKKVKQTIIFPDPVNSPEHYTSGGIETIDFIEAKELDYNLGNVVKYITRAGKKNVKKLEDLKKAQWYINRAVENLEK
jgi:hypothetical protein